MNIKEMEKSHKILYGQNNHSQTEKDFKRMLN